MSQLSLDIEHSFEVSADLLQIMYSDRLLATRIAALQNSFPYRDERALFANLVNRKTTGDDPFNRWFRYREGYGRKLVSELISRSNLDPNRHFVYDPMCGSGTTMVAAMREGYSSAGADVNPFSIDISNVKLTKPVDSVLVEALEFVSSLPRSASASLQSSGTYDVDAIEKYFNTPNFESVKHIYHCLQEVKNSEVRQLLFMAWLGIIEEASDRYKDGNGLAKRDSRITNVFDHFRQQVLMMVHDYRNSPIDPSVVGEAYLDSASNSEQIASRFTKLSGKELGTIIFSPPYANSFDYFESYKLELIAGYRSRFDIEGLKSEAIRSYRKGYGYQLDTDNEIVSLLGEEIWRRIPEKEARTGRKDGRSRLVPNLLVGYFEDMTSVLKGLAAAMPTGASCHIVVDQSAYLGVIIPTDLLLAEIGASFGLTVDAMAVCRLAKTSGQQSRAFPYLKTNLKEVIVSLSKTAA